MERLLIYGQLYPCHHKEQIRWTNNMDSDALARYIEESGGISKPWLLVQLRMQKLQERKDTMPPEEYVRELASLHQDLMNLGEWWVGIEDEVFNP